MTTSRLKWREQLARRPPEEWADRLDALDDPVGRVHAAQVVWWDWFSMRPANTRWAHLDRYLDSWDREQKVDMPRLCAALVELGYPSDVADARVRGWAEEVAATKEQDDVAQRGEDGGGAVTNVAPPGEPDRGAAEDGRGHEDSLGAGLVG